MFVIELTYRANLAEIDAQMAAHVRVPTFASFSFE